MYNYDLYLINLAAKKAKAAESKSTSSPDSNGQVGNLSPARRSRRLKKIYKKSLSSMVSSSNERQFSASQRYNEERDEEERRLQEEERKNEGSRIYRPKKKDMRVQDHTFRDRIPSRELSPNSNGHVSPSTYVPRSFYWGGGLLDSSRTAQIRNLCSPVTVSSLDPRPATASFVDGGRITGRLDRAPYSSPIVNGGLRAREKYKEIQPPLRFTAQTESQRVNESITNSAVVDSGPWEESLGSEIVWRPVTPEKWVGGRFRPYSPPVTHDRQLNGRVQKTVVEPFVISPNSVHGIAERANALRTRDKTADLAGEFQMWVPKDEWIKSNEDWKNPRVWVDKGIKKGKGRTFHSSLRSAPSSFKMLGETLKRESEKRRPPSSGGGIGGGVNGVAAEEGVGGGYEYDDNEGNAVMMFDGGQELV